MLQFNSIHVRLVAFFFKNVTDYILTISQVYGKLLQEKEHYHFFLVRYISDISRAVVIVTLILCFSYTRYKQTTFTRIGIYQKQTTFLFGDIKSFAKEVIMLIPHYVAKSSSLQFNTVHTKS